MHLTKGQWFLAAFTALYVIGFGGYFLLQQNYEFLWYVAVLVFFFGLIGATLSASRFPLSILWLLSIWGFAHMAGGGITLNEHVLYAQQLVHLFGSGDAFVLKYDQVVHAYGFFVAAFVMHHLITMRSPWRSGLLLAITAALASMGLGVVNEIVEFLAVVVAPETGVGGYYNTALDLVFNTIGAAVAGTILFVRSRRAPVVE